VGDETEQRIGPWRLKIPCRQRRAGSSPAPGTNSYKGYAWSLRACHPGALPFAITFAINELLTAVGSRRHGPLASRQPSVGLPRRIPGGLEEQVGVRLAEHRDRVPHHLGRYGHRNPGTEENASCGVPQGVWGERSDLRPPADSRENMVSLQGGLWDGAGMSPGAGDNRESWHGAVGHGRRGPGVERGGEAV